MKVIFVGLALCALIATTYAITLEDVPAMSVKNGGDFSKQDTLALFRQFQDKHGDVSPLEYEMRLENFRATLRMVAKQNAAPGNKAIWGITKFAAMSQEEFAKFYLSKMDMSQAPSFDDESATPVEPLGSLELPSSFDWRTHTPKVVTPVKNQGQCGSCWAFSATENIESIWALSGKDLAVLAPQQIVDCDTAMQGCNGGWPVNAIKYIKEKGQESEASYPYTAQNGQCQYSASKVVAHITGWRWATQHKNESEILAHLQKWGPLSVAVDASTWSAWSGGIITAQSCGHQIDHGVSVVGWSGLGSGSPYYIVRNSWGSSWGLDGYIHVEYGANACSIAEFPASAIADNNPSTTSSGNSGNSGHSTGGTSGGTSSGGTSGGTSSGGTSSGGTSSGGTSSGGTSSGGTSSGGTSSGGTSSGGTSSGGTSSGGTSSGGTSSGTSYTSTGGSSTGGSSTGGSSSGSYSTSS